MRNKKGFVLIETIVTIAILATSLLYVYSNFNDILIKENTRVHYDDVAYIYKTFYIKEYFYSFELKNAIKTLNKDNPMIIIGCDYEGMFGSVDEFATIEEQEAKEAEILANKTVCNDIMSDLNVKSIAISISDLSYIQECNDENTNCNYLKNFSKEKISYLETLGKLNTNNRHVMVIEYSEESSEKDLENINFAWIKI